MSPLEILTAATFGAKAAAAVPQALFASHDCGEVGWVDRHDDLVPPAEHVAILEDAPADWRDAFWTSFWDVIELRCLTATTPRNAA